MALKILCVIIIIFGVPVFFAWFMLNVYPWFKNPILPLLIDGFVAKGFESVQEVFQLVIEEKCKGGGAGFSVYYQGNLIVDLWGGYADSELLRPWKKDTLTLAFSVTKGIASLCVAILVDRGLLNYDNPVRNYWPEFAQNGKENITVKMLLSHQAALIGFEHPLELSDLHNPFLLKKILEENKPSWPPGEEFGYGAFSYGFYVSQLIQLVDPKKRTVSQFFEEEIAKPLGIDFHIGLPKTEYHRVARLWEAESNIAKTIEQIFDSQNFDVLKCYFSLNPLFQKAMTSINVKLGSLNSPEWLEVEIPAANGVGTARSLAKFYGHIMSEGQIHGDTLLSRNIISKLMKPVNIGKEKVMCMNMTGGYGLWHLANPNRNGIIIGHPGYGGQIAGGDLESQIGFGFVSNVISSDMTGLDPRFLSLFKALYESLATIKKYSN